MDTDNFQVSLQNTLAKGNMSILVLDQGYHTVISSVNESNILGTRLLENIYGSGSKDRETLESSDRYTLSRMRDGFLKNDYLELWGSLDNGDIFILRSPIESIRESVAVSNRFLGYIGVAVVLVGDCDHFLYFQTDHRADPAAGRHFKKNVRVGF